MSSFLLDTNVISEPSKLRPSPSVVSFIEQASSESLYISVLTLGELRKGAVRKQPHSKSLLQLTEAIERKFAERILPVTPEIARIWGDLSAGRSRPVVDTLLAATALAHSLILVTRNTKDFADIGIPLLNPWD